MRGSATAIIALFSLTGCVNYSQMHSDMSTGLSSLEGRNIELAIDRLGIPNDSRVMGESTVYTWLNDNVIMSVEPGASPLKCEIRIRADSQGTILSGDYNGNQGACLALRDKLLAR